MYFLCLFDRRFVMSKNDIDTVWIAIREESRQLAEHEPLLASFLHDTVLSHTSLEDTLSFHLANKLGSPTIPAISMREIIDEALRENPNIGKAVRCDIKGILDRDPACSRYSAPLLYFKGFLSLQSHRVAHWLWNQGREGLALYLQSMVTEMFNVDIHPAAKIGCGILIDHASGVVIGETAVIDDNVSMLHQVTLGGTGKETGDRHPKVRSGVLIGAGAKILGNIEIGEGAKVGANSVVLKDVPPHTTVAGVPAKVIGKARVDQPALEMDQQIYNNND
jgi:serine O-acetyltransferase